MISKIDDVQDAVNHLIALFNREADIFLPWFSTDVKVAVDFTSDGARLRKAQEEGFSANHRWPEHPERPYV